jgi:hypothetical protein
MPQQYNTSRGKLRRFCKRRSTRRAHKAAAAALASLAKLGKPWSLAGPPGVFKLKL